MSKSTNKQQIELLIDLMQSHPEIAQGCFKGGKEALHRFWRKAEEELNSAGPPAKCIAEWKKVWADQKKYVRQKAANNHKSSRGTGGGPNNEYKFSTTERAIFELIGMKESVEGVGNKFGLPSRKKILQQINGNIQIEDGTTVRESGVVDDIVQVSECELANGFEELSETVVGIDCEVLHDDPVISVCMNVNPQML
ncbi:uncharacterized protein [Eurosta solidaginis]|uniref:uncharacterized protein n=1 Tax=Eurosta solidaginis TaxID=178769 RepID=UPI0035310E51